MAAVPKPIPLKRSSPRNYPAISASAFVRAWQIARSLESLAQELGIPVKPLTARAAAFRKKGVPLKKFSGRRGIVTPEEWAKLRELALQVTRDQSRERATGGGK